LTSCFWPEAVFGKQANLISLSLSQTRKRDTEAGTNGQANSRIAKNEMTKNKTNSRAESYR